MKAGEDVSVHQLLGRIAYFHALFIEPVLMPVVPADGVACCTHTAIESGGVDTTWLLEDTAWAVVDEIGASLAPSVVRCPIDTATCCVTCRIHQGVRALAAAWVTTEHDAYHGMPVDQRTRDVCADIAGHRISRVFAAQHDLRCSGLNADDDAGLGINIDALPLTAELLALWQNPIADVQSPVISWLNHCTDLQDVRRVLALRRPKP